MATHSSILAWRIPWTEEPGELKSMGSQRVRHDCVTNTHMCVPCVSCSICPCPLDCSSLHAVHMALQKLKYLFLSYLLEKRSKTHLPQN